MLFYIIIKDLVQGAGSHDATGASLLKRVRNEKVSAREASERLVGDDPRDIATMKMVASEADPRREFLTWRRNYLLLINISLVI
jgi:hypothetical protein